MSPIVEWGGVDYIVPPSFLRADFFITDEVVERYELPIREGPGFLFGCPVTVARDEQACQWIIHVTREHRPHLADFLRPFASPTSFARSYGHHEQHEHYEFRRGGWEAPPFPGPTRSHLEQAQDRADTFLQRSNDVLEEHDAWNPADELAETWAVDHDYVPSEEVPGGNDWPFKSF